MSGCERLARIHQHPPQLLRRWPGRTLTIIGAAVLTALTAAIAAAATTSLPGTTVAKAHEAFTTGPSTVAVSTPAVGAVDGLTAIFPITYERAARTVFLSDMTGSVGLAKIAYPSRCRLPGQRNCYLRVA
jgi:hypothetical protein